MYKLDLFLSCSLNSWGSSRAFRKINRESPVLVAHSTSVERSLTRAWIVFKVLGPLARQAKKSWGNVSLYQSTKVDWSRPIKYPVG